MRVADDLERIAAVAADFAAPNERMTGILAVAPHGSARVFLCAYESADGHAWLALDDDARPVESRQLVHDAASLAALCEVAEESAGGGDVDELRKRLRELDLEEADAAAAELADVLAPGPRVATHEYLDALGAASRRLEQALGDDAGSPFAIALQQALPAVEELAAQVEARHKLPLA